MGAVIFDRTIGCKVESKKNEASKSQLSAGQYVYEMVDQTIQAANGHS